MKLLKTEQIPAIAMSAIVAFTMSAQAWQGMPISQLHVNGRNLQDTSGKNVLLHGYMQPSDCFFNGGCGAEFVDPTGYYPSDAASALSYFEKVAELMSRTSSELGQSHGYTCSYVRYGDSPGWDSNGNLADPNELSRWINNVLVPYVQYCRSVGLYVCVAGGAGNVLPGGDGTKNMTAIFKRNLITYWTMVASNSGIKNADNVMFEICNEPVAIETSLGNGQWGSGTDAFNAAFQTYMQDICNAIRGTGANNMIWVPSLAWDGTLWQFVKYPISGNNIGYIGHWYPFGDFNSNDFISHFNSQWKPCADLYPVLVTECAWDPHASWSGAIGDTSSFGNTTKSLFDAEGNISWDIGMTGDDIGNLGGGWNNITYPTTQCGQAAFAWWPTYMWSGPSGNLTVGNGTFKIIERGSGKAIDAIANGTANGTQIDQWTYNGGNNQKWTLTSLGGSTYKIIGVQSGRSLDIFGNGTANGTVVDLWDYNGGNNQKFAFSSTDSGYYRITPQNATGSCLDLTGNSTADGALLDLWSWNSGVNQQWGLQSP